jgi:cephalosporin hydroxylase
MLKTIMRAKGRAVRKVRRVSTRLGLIPDDDFWRFQADPRSVSDQDRNASDLHRMFYNHDGLAVMKWKNYLSVYDRYLARFRNQPVRILELGVQFGGSLDLWRKYFGPQAIIFGIDINPSCASCNGQSGQVRIGSQDDPTFLTGVISEMGGVDVVIDDGSHIVKHQRASFEILFPTLADGGVYICEDLHTSYWPNFGGGYRRRGTFIEYAKSLMDDMHSDFHVKAPMRKDASRTIEAIHLYNSIAVIEKRAQERPSHFKVGHSGD